MELALTQQRRELISRFGDMDAMRAMTQHRRGVLFDYFLAELLTCHGIAARADVRGTGGRSQIDVAFAVGGRRFIAEAKWTATPTNVEPIAKLNDRLSSRGEGTWGVIVSMSGYTAPVLDQAAHSKWPRILLLDRAHVEAILSGLIDATALLDRLLDHAAFEGGSYRAMNLCLPQGTSTPPRFVPSDRAEPPWPVVADAGRSARADLTGVGAWPEQSGMAGAPDGNAAVTTSVGVVAVSVATGDAGWLVPIVGCRSAPVVAPDGTVTVICGQAVIRWDDGDVNVVGGGFTGNSHLISGAGATVWVFDQTGERYASQLTLTRLGDRLGQEMRYAIRFNADVWCAAWLGGERFFLSASGHSAVVDLATAAPAGAEKAVDFVAVVEEADWIKMPHPAPRFAVPLNGRDVVTCSDSGSGIRSTVCLIDTESRRYRLLADLAVNRTFGIHRDRDGMLRVLADVRGNDAAALPVVITLDAVTEG
ncbi:MAG: hypothetical protein HOV83_36715 [Catenulispora sp.]|nr:hypothetical protein [Catenulispora sp.]